MKYILTEEEYIALNAKSQPPMPDLVEYRKRLEAAMFPLLMQVIREAHDIPPYGSIDQFLRGVAAKWSETFNSVPVVKP